MKSADLNSQLDDVHRQLDEADRFDPAFGQTALAVSDFSQNLPEIRRGSNSAQKRELLDVVSLNRKVSDVSLVLTKKSRSTFSSNGPF
ncbi:MAG: hypothetical protein ACYC26_03375 [Phycisphaerales bacterium]